MVDKENDQQHSKMSKEEKQMLEEEEAQIGKVDNDIVEVFIKQKC